MGKNKYRYWNRWDSTSIFASMQIVCEMAQEARAYYHVRHLSNIGIYLVRAHKGYHLIIYHPKGAGANRQELLSYPHKEIAYTITKLWRRRKRS